MEEALKPKYEQIVKNRSDDHKLLIPLDKYMSIQKVSAVQVYPTTKNYRTLTGNGINKNCQLLHHREYPKVVEILNLLQGNHDYSNHKGKKVKKS